MRGHDEQTHHMFSYLSPEQRVPADHPLRAVRAALLHESELARTDPGPQFLHRPMRCDIGLPSPVI